MKRLLSGAITLALAGHAQAAPAIISGSGTGGALFTATTNSASQNFVQATTTVDVPPGSLLIIGVADSVVATTSISSCTDGTANSYAPAQTGYSSTTFTLNVYYSYTTIDVPNGSTIKCTFSSTSGYKMIDAVAFSGMASSPLDSGSVPTPTFGTGTATSITTGTLAQASEVVFGIASTGTGETFTQTSGFTSLGTAPSRATNFAYLITTTTTAKTYSTSFGTSISWASVAQGFEASGGSSSGKGCFLHTLGVGVC